MEIKIIFLTPQSYRNLNAVHDHGRGIIVENLKHYVVRSVKRSVNSQMNLLLERIRLENCQLSVILAYMFFQLKI